MTESSNLSDLTNIIFKERDQLHYIIRFCDLYNFLKSYVEKNNLDVTHYDDKDECISTFTISLFCCLKSFTDKENQKEFIKLYIETLTKYLEGTKFKAVSYTNYSFYDFLKSFFTPSDKLKDIQMTIVYRIPIIIDDIYSLELDYYNIQMKLSELFKSSEENSLFHEDYINTMTFGFYVFLKIINNYPNKKELASKYLKNLFEFNLLSEQVNLYDNPSYKGIIKY